MPPRQVCDRCGAEIPAQRLEAVPDTRLCIAWAREVEARYGGEFELIVDHERVSKPGSLRRNFGGITIRARRRPLPPNDAPQSGQEHE